MAVKVLGNTPPPLQEPLVNPKTGMMTTSWSNYFMRLPFSLGNSDTLIAANTAAITTNTADIATIEDQLAFVGRVADGATTTGTVEEVLATIPLPVGAMLEASRFSGFTLEAMVSCANNANNKTVRMRVGGLTGALAGSRADATANNIIVLRTDLFKIFDGTYDYGGLGITARVTGVSAEFPETIAAGAVTYTGTVNVVVTGETPTAAGDLTLLTFVVIAIPGET